MQAIPTHQKDRHEVMNVRSIQTGLIAMGMYIVQGREYLLRLPRHFVYRDQLERLAHAGVYYNDSLEGFIVASDTEADRLYDVQQSMPEGWYPRQTCTPAASGRALDDEEQRELTRMRRIIRAAGVDRNIFGEDAITEGWFEVEYVD